MCTLDPGIWIWVQPTDHGCTSRGWLMISPQLLPRDSKGRKKACSSFVSPNTFWPRSSLCPHSLSLCGRSMNDPPKFNALKQIHVCLMHSPRCQWFPCPSKTRANTIYSPSCSIEEGSHENSGTLMFWDCVYNEDSNFYSKNVWEVYFNRTHSICSSWL